MAERDKRHTIDIFGLLVFGLVGFLLEIGLQLLLGLVFARTFCQGSNDQQFFCTSTLVAAATVSAAASAGLLYARHFLSRERPFGLFVIVGSSLTALIALFSFPVLLFALGIGFQEAFDGVSGILQRGGVAIVSGALGGAGFYYFRKRRHSTTQE